jgi:hypothetical protein
MAPTYPLPTIPFSGPGHAARAVEPLADLHPAAGADQGQGDLMTVFEGAVGATFAAFGTDARYTPVGGDPVPVRVIARRPDTSVGFGETRIHAETATFELRAKEVADPRPGDQLRVGGETFVVQGEPEGGPAGWWDVRAALCAQL